MKVAVVHNPTSGDSSVSEDELCEAITSADHIVASYVSTKVSSWDERVATGADLVVAAGGDGTVREVFIASSRWNAAVSVLALGTCNNVARTLGLPTRHPLTAISMWRDEMIESRYHLARVTSHQLSCRLIEGAGVGLFAELIRRADEAHAGSADPWAVLREVITDPPTDEWSVGIDGQDASGRYLAVHATTVRHTGPNFTIAPEADPSSSEFNVVLIREEQRRETAEYVDARLSSQPSPTPTFEVIPARRVEIQAAGPVTMSVDDVVLEGAPGWLTVEAGREYVRVLAPRDRSRSD